MFCISGYVPSRKISEQFIPRASVGLASRFRIRSFSVKRTPVSPTTERNDTGDRGAARVNFNQLGEATFSIYQE